MIELNLPGSYTGRFEAHITVEAASIAERERFRRLCRILGVKYVFIELPRGETPSQPMTASYHQGNMEKVKRELDNLTEYVRIANFPIVRVKLEADLDTEGVPQMDSEARDLPEENYFEFHVKVLLPVNSELDLLQKTADVHNAHLSRNARKTRTDGKPERFLTLRLSQIGARRAEMRLSKFLSDLRKEGFEIMDVIREYNIFDNNAQTDKGWTE